MNAAELLKGVVKDRMMRMRPTDEAATPMGRRRLDFGFRLVQSFGDNPFQPWEGYPNPPEGTIDVWDDKEIL